MGKDMQNVPKLRFGEFSDNLEQYKVPYMMERVAATAESGPLPSIEYDDIEPDIGLLNKDVASKEARKRGIVFQQGDVLFGKLRPYLKNWLYCTFPGVAVGDFWVLRPWHADGLFFYYFMQTAGFQGVANQSTGSKMPRADWNLVSEYGWSIPYTRDEQHRIGMLLRSVDDLIILQMRKLSKLQDLKKALLVKMFPAEGESLPAVRFNGFTDAWEQRKLGELAGKTYGGGTPATANKAFWQGTLPWIQSSDIAEGEVFGVEPRKYISTEAVKASAAQMVPANSIALVTRVGVGKLALMPFQYATSQDFLSLSELHGDPLYVAYACYQLLQKKRDNVQGTSIKGMTKEVVLEKKVFIPSHGEQAAVGKIFYNLDTLITFQQRKLSKLKDIKKALLNNMFPGGDI